jgi:capsular exopolysaccharide synthesis family protein
MPNSTRSEIPTTPPDGNAAPSSNEAADIIASREEREETVFSVASPSSNGAAPSSNGAASSTNGDASSRGARDGASARSRANGPQSNRMEDETEERGTALALVEGHERRRERGGYERGGFDGGREDEDGAASRDGHGAGNGAAMEVADDASIRDFYSQLVTLLTQDNTARVPVKKNRAGLKDALRRRFWPALLIFLVTLGALGYQLRPRQAVYTSSVELLLPPRDTQTNRDPLLLSEDDYDAPAQIAIIGSEAIVREAMRHVPPDLRAKGFGDRNAQLAPVDVTPAGSDQLIAITVSSLNPRASVVTAGEMVKAYTNYTRNRFSQNRNENLRVTRKSADNADRQLRAAQQQVRDLKERYGFLDFNANQSNATNNIASLQSSLAAAQRDAIGAVDSDSTVLSLQSQVSAAQAAYDKVVRDFFEDSEQARAAKAPLDVAIRQLAARRAEIESNASARIARIQDDLSRARRQASTLPAIEQSYNQLNERVARLQTDSRKANERLSELGLLREAVAPVAKKLNSPSVGSTQTIQRARAFSVALLSALALSLLGALLLDRTDRSVRTAPDPENLFGAPVLGALPATNEHRTFYLAPTISNKGNARARTQTIEACTNAQNNILAAATAAGARSILITSALPEEGKSGCASNLAAAMAYGGREVLLVDVDFWHPSQHSNFDMELTPGYSQVLRENLPLSEAIRPTPVANLFLLSTGQDSSTPGDIIGMLQGRTNRQNMELLKKYFDIIVIDAPPTMTVADAQLLSGLADAVVLVTAEKTHRDEVQRARSMLRLAGAWILGVVVNSVRPGEVGGWNLNFSGEEPFAEYAQNVRGRGRH